MNTINCAFCSDTSLAKRTIAKNKLAWVFPTNIPIVPGHLLICPLRHVATFAELTEQEQTAIFSFAKQLQPVLKKVFGATGFNFAWNEDTTGGQGVPHFHLHILPRKVGDSGITNYEPRQFLYRPSIVRAVSPEQELQEISDLVRQELETKITYK